MNTGDGPRGEVIPFGVRPGAGTTAGGTSGADQVVVPYYPAKLKAYYLDLLLRYKNKEASDRRKAVGWLSIRDQIMAQDDEALVLAMKQRKLKVDVDRPRSADLTVDDLKGWYRTGNSHLPSDFKFQYIDRFIRGLRLEGRIETIERAVSEARQEYFRESMAQFYRPDLTFANNAYEAANDPRLEVHALINRAVFVGACQPGNEGTKELAEYGLQERFAVILFCGEFKRCAAPVELMACFVDDDVWNEAQTLTVGSMRSIGPDVISRCKIDDVRVISLYSGFFIPEFLGGTLGVEMVAGWLFTAKTSDTLLYHQGLPFGTSRYYQSKVRVFSAHGGVMLMEGTATDALTTLGLEPITEGSGFETENRSGLVKCQENSFLREIRAKFEIGYRPC